MNIIGAISGALKVVDRVQGSNNYSETLQDLKLKNSNIELLKSEGNMVNLMSKYVVNPVIFVSEDSYNRTDIDVILQHATDIYASFYMQVFKILINQHNMDSNTALSVLSTSGIDVENWGEVGLVDPSLIDIESLTSDSYLPSLDIDAEAKVIGIKREASTKEMNDTLDSKTIIRTIEINATTTRTMDTGSPMVVSLDVPITVKASVLVYPMPTIISSVKFRGADASLFSRIIKWKIGSITTSNLLLGNDLAEDYRKGTLSRDGFSKMLNKASVNHISIGNLLDKNIGVNKTIFTYIITDDEATKLAKELGYKLSGSDLRKALNALLAFNLVTINEDRDMITSYINGISGASVSSIKKLTKDSKGSSADSIELIASAMLANRPY